MKTSPASANSTKQTPAGDGDGPSAASTWRADSSDTLERAFVYTVFIVMVAGLIWYVWLYGRNVPFWDDWETVPVLSGNQPFSLSWLWEQQNEHRLPLVHLIMYLAWRVFGDLRLVMLLTNFVVAAVAFALLQVVRTRRGRVSYTDAFLPLVLLNWGMYENMIFAIQLFFVAAPSFALAILAITLSDWHGRLGRVVAIGVLLMLLPVTGAIGLTLAPGMTALVAYLGLSRLRHADASGRRDGTVLLLSSLLVTLAAAVYFVGLHAVPQHPQTRSFVDVARTVAEIVSMSIGPAGQFAWPFAALGAMAAITLALVFAAAVAYSRFDEREQAVALLATMAAFGVLVVVVGFGRSGFGQGQGFSDRYAIFSAPLLCCSYLSMSLFARDARGRLVRTMLLLTMTAALVTNTRVGIAYGIDRADRADALCTAIDAGAPPAVAAARNWERLYPDQKLLADRLEMLRVSGGGPYGRRMNDEGSGARYREAELPLRTVSTNQSRERDGLFECDGDDPYVVLGLPSPEYVCGVRLEFTVSNPSVTPSNMEFFWCLYGHYDFAQGRRSETLVVPAMAGTHETTVWIYDTIDRLRIDPDRQPCNFKLVRAVFLLRDDKQ